MICVADERGDQYRMVSNFFVKRASTISLTRIGLNGLALSTGA